MMWSWPGYFRALRHHVPPTQRPNSWDYPWMNLDDRDRRALTRGTDGYYFAVCGAVAVRPTLEPPPGHRPKWATWNLCPVCMGRVDTTS